MTDLIADLVEVAERVSAATPEKWAVGRYGGIYKTGGPALLVGASKSGPYENRLANEAAACCAVNFIRAHAAEIEMMARDAERWRKVRMGRSDWHGDVYAMTFAEDGDYPVCGDQLDALADAMRSAKEDSHA